MTIDVGVAPTPVFNNARVATTAGVTTQVSGSSFCLLIADDGTSVVPSDNKGNTANYFAIGTRFTGVANVSLWLCTNGAGGAGHTFTATSSGGSTDVQIYPVELTAGALASLVDVFPVTQWNDDVASPFTSNSATTTLANDLVLAFCITVTTSGTETLTFGNGYVQVVADGSSAHFSGGIAKLLLAVPGATNASFTSAGGGTSEAIVTIVAFKDAAPDAGASQILMGGMCL